MITKIEQCILEQLGSDEEKEEAIDWLRARYGHKFIHHEPEEGQLTLGVVYHMLRRKDIENAFRDLGEIPPRVIGWVVSEEDEDEEEN